MSKQENKLKANDVKDNSVLPEGKTEDEKNKDVTADLSKDVNPKEESKDKVVENDKEINFSKSDVKKLTDDIKEGMLNEFGNTLLMFSTMSSIIEKLLEKADVMAKVNTKEGDHTVAGEFINLHSALSIAFNKLKSLSEKAKTFAENHKL